MASIKIQENVRKRQRWSFTITVVLASLILVGMAAKPLLRVAADILIRDDSPRTADYIVLLMGDSTSARAETALRLYREGIAPKIILMREKPSRFVMKEAMRAVYEVHRDFLFLSGLPEAHFVGLTSCDTTSTVDEAHCLAAYLARTLDANVPIKLAVVTSWYHTGRAGWLFDRVFANGLVEIAMVAAPMYEATPAAWWQEEDSFLAVFNEYLKWTYWRLKVLSQGERIGVSR